MSSITRERAVDGTDQPPSPGGDGRSAKTSATDEDSEETPDEPSPPNQPPHLPASCLANALNFLPYSDVRKCMRTGKLMSKEAAGQVETLNIMKPSELVVPAARRFANASEVNVLCLVGPSGSRGRGQLLSVKAATQLVFFLTAFPKLTRAYIGGLFWSEYERQSKWSRRPYDPIHCRQPEDHRAVYRALVENLCGAYRSKMLRPQVNIDGILSWILPECCDPRSALNEKQTGRPCRCCRDIIASFPFRFLFLQLDGREFCVPFHTRLALLLERPGSKEFLCTFEGMHLLTRMLNMMFRQSEVRYRMCFNKSDVDDFVNRLKSEGAREEITLYNESVHIVYYLLPSQLRQLGEALQSFKDEICKIPKHSLNNKETEFLLSTKDRYGKVRKPIVVRQTIEGLISLGFNLDPSDYCLVDPLVEPALSGVKDRFDRDV